MRAECQLRSHLPGLIIFVHGVNSQGEWYAPAEAALCDGLNTRLGRVGTKDELKPITYSELDDQKRQTRRTPVAEKDEIPNSPVIRFYWGYRAPDGKELAYRIPLRNLAGDDFHAYSRLQQQHIVSGQMKEVGPFYWGGGPFQNGCNALPMMWSTRGFSKWAWLGPFPISTQAINTAIERQLQASPPRTYYAYAAKRLADLIDRIRTSHRCDTVTVISHSQGTMVALAAAAISPPDALILMNSPYALDDKVTDTMTSGNARATVQARQKTFINIVKKIGQHATRLQDHPDKPLFTGASKDENGLICGWKPEATSTHPGEGGKTIPERDNHGRTYVYFSPHDRVMGMSALQSIGWQGLPNNDQARPILEQCKGLLFQRMLARNTPCGVAPNPTTPYGTLPDMVPTTENPQGNPFWDGNEKVLGVANLWTVPPRGQTVNINAEEVPAPLKPAELAIFDKPRDRSAETNDEIGTGWGQSQLDENGNVAANDPDFKYFSSIYEPEFYVEDSSLRARLDAGPNHHRPPKRLETREEMLARIKRYHAEPTDHSSLPGHAEFMKRVVAYDLPIGHCDAGSDLEFMQQLRQQADWTWSDPYMKTGQYDVPPMPAEIEPETVQDIVDERAQNRRRYGH